MEYLTKGGIVAHIGRRLFHLSMLIVPLLYYQFSALVPTKILHLSIIAFVFFVFLIEKLRIRYRLVFFGLRSYEAMQISAFGWTILSLGILLLVSPGAGYSIAIVVTCAFVDPLMGELWLHKINKRWVILAGICVGMIVWAACVLIYQLPLWLVLLMPPIAVVVEWLTLKSIDDNAMMLLVPLVVILALQLIIK